MFKNFSKKTIIKNTHSIAISLSIIKAITYKVITINNASDKRITALLFPFLTQQTIAITRVITKRIEQGGVKSKYINFIFTTTTFF